MLDPVVRAKVQFVRLRLIERMHAECASDKEHRRSIRPYTKAASDIRASKWAASGSDVTDISRQGGQTEWKWDYKQVVPGENDRQKDVSRRKQLTEQRQQVRLRFATIGTTDIHGVISS